MKNLIYFHGIHGNTAKTIAPWLEQELKKYNINVVYPKFFNDGEAFFENFQIIAQKLINDKVLNDDSILVAHSIGNPFVVTLLEKYQLKPKAYISLAGFSESFEVNNIKEQINNSVPTKIAIDYIKNLNITKLSFYSNDHIVPQETLKNFSKQINSKLYYLEGKGHFGTKSGVQELPELIKVMKENKII